MYLCAGRARGGRETRIDAVASMASALCVPPGSRLRRNSLSKLLEELSNSCHESVELTAAGCSGLGQR